MEENQGFNEIQRYYAKLLKASKRLALNEESRGDMQSPWWKRAAVRGREGGAYALVLTGTCE